MHLYIICKYTLVYEDDHSFIMLNIFKVAIFITKLNTRWMSSTTIQLCIWLSLRIKGSSSTDCDQIVSSIITLQVYVPTFSSSR